MKGIPMKNTLLTLFAGITLIGCAAGVSRAELKWATDFDAAKKTAEEKELPILINFTGSDWCGWCIRLHKEVFATETFKEYAENNLVLFEADFPRRSELDPEIKKQNEALAKRYGIRGFPTILLVDSNGDVLGTTGYRKGGPEEYRKHLQQLLGEASEGAEQE